MAESEDSLLSYRRRIALQALSRSSRVFSRANRTGTDDILPQRRRRLALVIGCLVAVVFARTHVAAEELDLRASRVYIKVGKKGFGHEHAVTGRLKSGAVQIGATKNAGQIVFDMPSFDADNDEARQYIGLTGATDIKTRQEVNANMLGPDVLDTKQYPTAMFEVESAVILGKRSREGRPLVRLLGDFTLHGVTRPLEVTAELVETPQRSTLRGFFTVKQSQFGIKPFSKAFGAIGVADDLTIHGELVVAPPQSAQGTAAPRR